MWFNFMLATTALAISIMWSTAVEMHHSTGIFGGIGARQIDLIIELNNLAFFAITLLFFCMTLARSTFAGKGIHGIIAGIVGFAYSGLFLWISGILQRRSMEFVQQEFIHYHEGIEHLLIHGRYMHQIGLRYGRIPIYEFDHGWIIYVDIFHIGFTLAMSIAAITATYYLLKRRTSLK